MDNAKINLGFCDGDEEEEEVGIQLLSSSMTTIKSQTINRHETLEDTKSKTSQPAHIPLEAASSFEDLGLESWLVKSCKAIGITKPTAVQRSCIPPVLAGKDVIACAQTGSGKTAAFALPILQKLAEDPYGIYAVVLTPTRELAIQLAEQFKILGVSLHIRVALIVGGLDMMKQALMLDQKPHIVIATPGRLADHFASSSGLLEHFNRVRFLVLDEADTLLVNKSFKKELKSVVLSLPPPTRRRTLLFSATLTESSYRDSSFQLFSNTSSPFEYNIPQVVNTTDNNSNETDVDEKEGDEASCGASVSPSLSAVIVSEEIKNLVHFSTVEQLKQEYLLLPPNQNVKYCYLVFLLKNVVEANRSVIVFTSSCWSCALIRQILVELDIKSVALHSMLHQSQRNKSLEVFKSQYIRVLVATDVAARGLDIPKVDLVINFNLPLDTADYVHRVGRTARAGREGTAISFVSKRTVPRLLSIEKCINKKLSQYEAHGEEEMLQELDATTTAKEVASVYLEDSGFGEKELKRKEKNLKAAMAKATKTTKTSKTKTTKMKKPSSSSSLEPNTKRKKQKIK